MAVTLLPDLPDGRLPGVDHAGRRDRLRLMLADEAAVAALVVTSRTNILYLTGFDGSAGVLILGPTADADLLVTDDRYAEVAADLAPDVPRHLTRQTRDAVLDHLAGINDAGSHPPAVGFEAEHLTWQAGETYRQAAGQQHIDLQPTTGLVEGLRTTKDDHEVAALRAACRITDAAFEAILEHLRPGVTERQIAARLEQTMRDLGANGPAFPPIVASGPNSASPHHAPTDRAITTGDLVKMDFGARYAGYHADMTRTVAVGKPPDDLRRIHEIVRTAQAAGRDAARPGRPAKDIDAAARRIIEDAGHGDHFRHGTGHGVGLEIHEAPAVSRTASGNLAARMTMTVEPGIYLPGRGGVRIEDTVLVANEDASRDGGAAEALTSSPRDLLVL